MGKPTIFLDVDGVLADFVGGACKVHGWDPHELHGNWPAGTYDICTVKAIADVEFWRPINEAGAAFWHELDLIPGAIGMLEELQRLAPVVLLTSPAVDASSTAGKIAWIQRYFGTRFRDYLIGPAKHAVARREAVLVDDFELNCHNFENAGGKAVLFPQLWNRLHQLRGQAQELAIIEAKRHLRFIEVNS